MTIVGFTDVHLRASNPPGRIDNYPNAILGKLKYIFSYANDLKADAIVCSGDLGDNREWSCSWNLINQFVALRNICKDIPFITTVGQHDVEGQNIYIYDKYVLGMLEKVGILQVLHSGNYIDIGDIRVFGFGFGQIETEDFLKGRTLLKTDGKLPIALVHASVGSDSFFTIESIKSQNIKTECFAAFGDIHAGFEPHSFSSGAVAFSSGAVARKTMGERDNVPKFWVLEIDEDGECKLEFHDLPIMDKELAFAKTVEEAVSIEDTAKALKAKLERAKAMPLETSKEKVQRIGRAIEEEEEVICQVTTRIKE